MKGYAGIVMLLNMAVQFLLLLGTNRLFRRSTGWLVALPGSVAGGLYAGICLLPQFHFLSGSLCHFLLLLGIGLLSFGFCTEALRRVAVYILLNMALEGITVGLGADSLWYCALALVVLGILCGVGFKGQTGNGNFVPMELSYAGKQIQVTALRDTGNMLTDPMTGQPVLIVGPSVACRITGLSPQQLKSPLEAMVSAHIPGLRLIPYRTVGQGSAFLLALRMQVRLGDKNEKGLVAFAPEEFGKGNKYQALTGGNV
ncbi:MAG: sigma-E processing peptidase SpoIIGA [Oscillospiraceae bacterium]|nr:sigma-E processing peptidase SpoIIGA [Oscillospiraceae bacterium]